MTAALTVTFFATVCLICDTIAQGDIDATVNDALQSALFGGRPAPSVASPLVGSFQRAVSDPEILESFERAFEPYCYEMSQCDFSDPYRRTDGQCNNPINPLLGASFTPQQIDSPRTRSVDNSPLPSARTVSNRVFQGMTPVSARGSMKPAACFIIPVNIEDRPLFPPFQTCMHFVRHTGAPPLGCQNVKSCFFAICISFFIKGDHRQSETPTLTVPDITWLRRHNLIADALRNATGIKNDEILFQETKRIVIAELQHVTYNEFLPAVLDDKTMKAFNLRSRRSGHVDNYNPFIDPRTINAFGVAAYRMGHSLRMARLMSKEPKSRSDRFLVNGIRNRLFENFNFMGPSVETTSLDLGALNVQRGREHGIPSYNAYRQFCGLPRANFFTVTRGGHPDDIDLFAGGMSETPLPGSILGPTFQCLIAYQFSLYKHGDRFWYERTFPENPLAAFTRGKIYI
ncbi:peroxidase-like protein [Magallana gigas]|uniref:peroxidase-like protein n=1 Tax=Magallana gigas TaxID=29159 RepID=UPI00334073A5